MMWLHLLEILSIISVMEFVEHDVLEGKKKHFVMTGKVKT